MAVTLAPRLNTIAMRTALVAFCQGHASLAPFLGCETELPGGRTIHTPNPAGGSPLRSIVWKKNLQVIDGPRQAAWSEQEAPNLIWDEIQDDNDLLGMPSGRHKQRLKWTVRGLLTCVGATPSDADDRVIQVADVLRDIFLGLGANLASTKAEADSHTQNHHILDATWRGSLWDPIPRANPLISCRVINLEILAGEQ